MNVRLLLFALALATPLATPLKAQEARTPPAPDCLDARDVRQVEQDTPNAIAVADGQGRAFRIDFATACPGVNEATALKLEAPQGWACGQPGERVVVDGRSCAVSAVTPIDNRSFAAIARESSRQYAATLPGVTVTAKGRAAREAGRHTFQASTAVCFATRNVRGWSEDPKGVVVETNPRRSGGHRYYRVELSNSCSILNNANSIDFYSGFQNGLICGNPGDRILATPNMMEGDPRAPPASIVAVPNFALPGCDILAVYPRDSAQAPPP